MDRRSELLKERQRRHRSNRLQPSARCRHRRIRALIGFEGRVSGHRFSWVGHQRVRNELELKKHTSRSDHLTNRSIAQPSDSVPAPLPTHSGSTPSPSRPPWQSTSVENALLPTNPRSALLSSLSAGVCDPYRSPVRPDHVGILTPRVMSLDLRLGRGWTQLLGVALNCAHATPSLVAVDGYRTPFGRGLAVITCQAASRRTLVARVHNPRGTSGRAATRPVSGSRSGPVDCQNVLLNCHRRPNQPS